MRYLVFMCALCALLLTGFAPTPVRLGVDVLEDDGFRLLQGRHVALITNHTGYDSRGRSTIDVLRSAPGVDLRALFSPEHGMRGELDEKVASSRDDATGLPVYSLYGDVRAPTEEMLAGVDTLVFDIQDVGARFYTYISTMGLAMEAAARNHIRFVVLDRVNPINGVDIEGPLADADALSFTAWHPLPVRHGMTVGELARLFNGERHMGVDLQVVPLRGWRRTDWFDACGLLWRNPSPNMRSLAEATLYPGICLLEATNVSVGRGTDTPFEVVGAPWVEPEALARALDGCGLTGVRFVPIRFTPRGSVHAGVACGGVNVIVTDRARFAPVACGLALAAELRRLYPDRFTADKVNRLLVSRRATEALLGGADGATLVRLCAQDEARFRALRQPYLLYE